MHTNDRIEIKHLEVYAFVGVMEHEREEGQRFYIDLSCELGYDKASLTDQMHDTAHYGDLTESLVPLIRGSKRQLIEALAEDIAAHILKQFPLVSACTVTVHKPSAPVKARFQDISFSIYRQRRYPFYLGIGSNVGDRRAFVQGAIDDLKASKGVSKLRSAGLYESKAWGNEAQDDFINTVVTGEFEGSPYGLLEICQALEDKAGRQRKEKWGPRTLDIDILSFGDFTSSDPVLTLPHPYMTLRDFVRIPMQSLQEGAGLEDSGTVKCD